MITDDLIAKVITENAAEIAAGEISGFNLFDLVYGPLPVFFLGGEWEAEGEDGFSTGCTRDFGMGNEDIRTLADLAAKLNLEPWSFACGHGWDENEIHADRAVADYPEAAAALAAAREEVAYRAREEREFQRMCREENETIERDDLEMAAAARGETVEYFSGDTLAEAADEIGMPENSETARKYFGGLIHRAEAVRRAGKITHRHEATNYDDLLSRGVDRDTAREVMG